MPPKQHFRGIREYTHEDYDQTQYKHQEQFDNRKRKRQREVTACNQCRAHKISCDRLEPCGSCRKRSREDLCSYAHDSEYHGLVQTTPWNPASTSFGRLQEGNPLSQPVQNNIADERQNLCWGSHHWKQPIIEDMNWLANSNHLLSPQLAKMASLDAYLTPDRRKTLWSATVVESTYSPDEIERRLRQLCPPDDIARAGVSRYMASLHRVWPVVRTQALVSFEGFANSHNSPGSFYSGENLAAYLAIVGLGQQLPPLSYENFQSPPPKRLDGKTLMSSLRNLIMNLVQQAKRPTVVLFQCVVCLVLQEKLDLDWVDGHSSTAAMLALLGRMMLSLGLHRDPSHLGISYGEEHKQLRRNLFWSLAILDFEHAVYSGQPCLFPFQCSDVQVPESVEDGNWLPRAARSLPQLATKLHYFHDSSIRPVLPFCAETPIPKESARRLSDPFSDLSSETTFTEDFVAIIGSAYHVCLNNHLDLAADLAILRSDSVPAAAQSMAQDAIFRRLSANLSELRHVAHIQDPEPEDSGNSWALFVSSFLRCPIYYTCSLAFLMVKRTYSNPRSTSNTTKAADGLLRNAKSVLKLLESAIPLSYDNLKHFILLQMQLRTMDERAIEQPLSGRDLDAKGSLVVLATQQAIEYGIRAARMAIDRARELDDPPPNLLPDHDDSVERDGTRDMDDRYHTSSLYDDLDWTGLFDEWLVD